VNYVGACDPAFAAGGDAFTFTVAHVVGVADEARVVIDRLESWKGGRTPLNSDAVLDEIAALAHEFGIDTIISDQYASIPLADALLRRGVTMKAQALTNELKSDLFTSLKRLINLERIELPDRSDLTAELLALELRPTPSGKPRIAASGRAHDDLAMVIATAAFALLKKRPAPIVSPWVGEKQAEGDDFAAWTSRAFLRNANAPSEVTGDPSAKPTGTPLPWTGGG
jgi:hypothetical protein